MKTKIDPLCVSFFKNSSFKSIKNFLVVIFFLSVKLSKHFFFLANCEKSRLNELKELDWNWLLFWIGALALSVEKCHAKEKLFAVYWRSVWSESEKFATYIPMLRSIVVDVWVKRLFSLQWYQDHFQSGSRARYPRPLENAPNIPGTKLVERFIRTSQYTILRSDR